jgi:hypothetical protein
MENLTTLLEIISELRAENKALKVSDKEKGESSAYWYKAYSELDKERNQRELTVKLTTEN